jgi:suppressor of fused protein SUFU
LDTLLFMPPIVMKDQTLPEELILGGEPVDFLWVVPLTTAECNLKLEKGLEAILDPFQQHRHPHVFDPNRKSYV